MICPYTVDVRTVTQWQYEYDAEGRQSLVTQVDNSKRIEHKCKKSECGAWDCTERRCKYRGGT